MRRIVVLLCLVFVMPLVAQDRPPRVHRYPPDWNNALPQYEKRIQLLTASIKRDAFIMSRVMLAMGDLSESPPPQQPAQGTLMPTPRVAPNRVRVFVRSR